MEDLTNLTGVYEIFCKANGRRYVGSAQISFKARWGVHRALLKKGANSRHLQRAWDKYGEVEFEFRVLETCARDVCISREQEHIDRLWGTGTLFNLAKIAGGGCGGMEVSAETRAKISAKNKNPSAEKRAAISTVHKGKVTSVETRAKQSAAQLGRPRKLHTEETRAKMSASRRGVPKSAEHCARMSASQKGKPKKRSKL